jgi:phosphocarrier protein FPr
MRSQLRAILRASLAGRVHLLVPMVSTIDEWRTVRKACERERRLLGVAPVPLGIMVEVPATAIMAEQFAREVDFFSVGTNDLTQFTLAMDRDHPRLATQVDALNPAVLRLVSMTIDAAHRHGKWVSVCGIIAADAQAIPVLVGLGVDELSVSAADVPAVKARIRTLDRKACDALARRALAAASAAEVRRMSPAE